MSTPSRKPSETPPLRIAPLAALPVFLDLAGRPAVVIGGTPAAAWKAELLAAAGAIVTVIAGDAGAGMEALAASSLPAGLVRLERRQWNEADIAGTALVVADAVDDAEAARIAAAARAAGVPVNVIDRPAFCDFRFGAIVNRSPVVVGVSTGGAAPVLGQAIRRRIEAILPAAVGRWTASASALRSAIAGRIADRGRRRAFWEAFAERALAADAPEDVSGALATLIERAGVGPLPGSVTLVGAGPGDADSLTLGAVRALQSADVVLHDDLVTDEVLELARREAERIAVGKRAGRPTCRQDDITALMVSLAGSGGRVVRLKSGDPMIFGRGGEEIESLRSAGIPVSVVPGITAASAMAARLGVSLTHRGLAQGVRLVTGHGRDGGLPPQIDWRGLADPATSTIVYMGGRHAAKIAGRLIAEGLGAATPVAAMTAIGRQGERRWYGTLAAMAGGLLPVDDDPVLIGIGQVFAAAAVSAGRAAA